MQHNAKECWLWMKKVNYFVSLWEGERDLLESTKMDFLWDLEWTKLNNALGGDFHKEYLSLWISWSECDDIFVGVWHAECPIYQASTRECGPLLQSCAKAMMWRVCHVTLMVWRMPRHLLTRFDKSSDLWYTSSIWPYAGRAQSMYSYGTEIWLMSLAPTNEESLCLNEENTLIG